MQYRDEDEESNLFYQKYQKVKNVNGVIKPKVIKPYIQFMDNYQSTIPTTTTILNTMINKKRERHDSSSENEDNSDDNTEYKPQIISSNDNKPIIDKPSIKTIEFNMKPIDNNILSSHVKEQLFTSKNYQKEKKKRIEENYDNLALWAKGIIQLEQREKNKEEKDVTKESLDPMKRLISTYNDNNSTNINSAIQEERGFYLPKCKFSQSINRFHINPGHRWDGVDRSTGFERRYLEKINERKNKETEYFKLRTEEM